jgi:hypothetical protein
MQRKPDRNEQLGQFFTVNAGRLERVVARNVNNARRELIEDACANAWAILLRRADITLDARGFSWLTTVAINEALYLKDSATPTARSPSYLEPSGVIAACGSVACVDDLSLGRASSVPMARPAAAMAGGPQTVGFVGSEPRTRVHRPIGGALTSRGDSAKRRPHTMQKRLAASEVAHLLSLFRAMAMSVAFAPNFTALTSVVDRLGDLVTAGGGTHSVDVRGQPAKLPSGWAREIQTPASPKPTMSARLSPVVSARKRGCFSTRHPPAL